MRLTKTPGKLRLLALTLIAGSCALAQDSGWYIGANVGQTRAKIDEAKISSGLLGAGFTSTTFSNRDRDTGYKLFGGYQFNKYFALEGGYFDLGKFGFTATTVPAGTLTGDIKLKGLNFDLVASLPFTEKFSGFLRAGVNQAEAKDTFSGTGRVRVINASPSQRNVNYKFGGGLQYDFTKSIGMRAELERYRIGDAMGNKGDIDMASLGVLFRFGRSAPAPAPQAAPEPVVAPPPTAAKVLPVVVMAPVKTQQYCTILDLMFAIDADKIEREDLEKLKVLGTFMTKYPDITAVIEGHSDNVGSHEHNLVLSKQRAQSVVDYLVETHHIDRARLKAVGYAELRPIAENATDEGKRQNRRINAVIDCVRDLEGLKVAPARMTMAMEIEFDQAKDEVLPEHREDLRRVANFLKANPSVTATVEGHTGHVQATEKLAMEISERRAQNVVKFLVDNFGIAPSRLSAEGFGRSRPAAYNATLEGQQENRRVNIIINYPKK